MTASQYLNQIATLETRTQRDRERLEELRATSGISSLRYGCKVQTSRTDILGDHAAEVIDLEQKYVDDIVELETAKSETLNIIHTLDDEPCEQLLYLRYIRQLNFYEISDSMSFSLSYLHRLHNKALRTFQKRLESCGMLTPENLTKPNMKN